MLKLINVKPNSVHLYKQEDNFVEPGNYYQFTGRPSDIEKRSFSLKAVQVAGQPRSFMWLAPAEPWVKRQKDGLFLTQPAMDEEPDWSMIGIRPELLRSWQKLILKEVWNYLRSGMRYGRGWVAKLGAGKTLAGLMICQLFEPGEAVVLCSRYLFETWRSQSEEWGFACPLLSTYESAHKLPATVKCLVIDEVLSLKNSDAQRSVKALRIAERCEVAVGFTGIPTAGKGPMDFRWLRVLEPGCVPADETAWKFLFGLDTELKEVGGNKAYITTSWDESRVSAFVNPFLRTVDPAEINAELPEITYSFIECPAPSQYKQIAVGAATTRGVHKKLAQVLQCTDGFIYNDNEQPVRLQSPKLFAVKDFVENLGEPVILVANWTEAIVQLSELFVAEQPTVVYSGSKDVGAEIERFKSGQTKLMIVNAGYSKGMNLQKVCRTVCFLSTSTKPDDYQQMVGRVYRPGQKDAVQIIHFVCENTLDRHRVELVQKHTDCSENFINELLLKELER